jgi:hypothetical protein
MSVEIKQGVGFSSRTMAMYIGDDAKSFSDTAPKNELTAVAWSKWGDNNDLPKRMADDIENTGVLNAALEAKSRIAVGKGLMPFLLTGMDPDGKEQLEFCFDNEILDWLELNQINEFAFDKAYDRNAYGWNVSKLLFNRGGTKINRIMRHDVYEARLQRKDEQFRINNVYLSGDWSKAGTAFDATKMAKIALLQDGRELERLMNKGTAKEFAITNRRVRDGRQYYPMPLWYAARLWVNVARQVPAAKKAMFENQLRLTYIITVNNSYWERVYGSEWANYTPADKAAKQQELYDMIDETLTGTDKWFKSITAGKVVDHNGKEIKDIEIEVVDDKMKDGQLLPDSSAANSEIIFSLMMNPALMGNGQPGGPYSNNAGGSNVRESYLVQLMLMEAERKEIARELSIVAQVNGWSQKHNQENQRLVFRYPSGLLTTLDTGKSTKGEVL